MKKEEKILTENTENRSETQEVAAPAVQSDEENAKYAAARREAEGRLGELEKMQAELATALGYGSFAELKDALLSKLSAETDENRKRAAYNSKAHLSPTGASPAEPAVAIPKETLEIYKQVARFLGKPFTNDWAAKEYLKYKV